MVFGRSLEKDIGPGIDEEADIRCIGRLPSALDAIGLSAIARFVVKCLQLQIVIAAFVVPLASVREVPC
jgi:hypothetical protein